MVNTNKDPPHIPNNIIEKFNERRDSITLINSISDILSQIYVIRETGIVELARKYNDNCFTGDSQLFGGFLPILMLVGGSVILVAKYLFRQG